MNQDKYSFDEIVKVVSGAYFARNKLGDVLKEVARDANLFTKSMRYFY